MKRNERSLMTRKLIFCHHASANCECMCITLYYVPVFLIYWLFIQRYYPSVVEEEEEPKDNVAQFEGNSSLNPNDVEYIIKQAIALDILQPLINSADMSGIFPLVLVHSFLKIRAAGFRLASSLWVILFLFTIAMITIRFPTVFGNANVCKCPPRQLSTVFKCLLGCLAMHISLECLYFGTLVTRIASAVSLHWKFIPASIRNADFSIEKYLDNVGNLVKEKLCQDLILTADNI